MYHASCLCTVNYICGYLNWAVIYLNLSQVAKSLFLKLGHLQNKQLKPSIISIAEMQCLSFSFPQPTTTFSSIKQHEIYPSLCISISLARNISIQSNINRHMTSIHRPNVPRFLATNVHLQSHEALAGGLEPDIFQNMLL